MRIQLLVDAFAKRFEVSDGRNIVGGPQLTAILSRIRQAHALVVEATTLVPNLLLELGMAYGLAGTSKKRSFLLFNTDATPAAISDLPDYIRHFDIISYSMSADSAAIACEKLYEKLQFAPAPAEQLRVSIRGINLRPAPADTGVYVYFPPDRPIWRVITPKLRDALEEEGMRLITAHNAPTGSSRIEEVIYNVSMSSTSIMSCFVDTTAGSSVDLVGAFALGAATGVRRNVERLVENGSDNPRALSMWTERTFEWESEQRLIDHIVESVVRSRGEKSR